MVFSSETFLFLFLPLFLVVYYLTPMRFRSVTILIGSYAFYGWWRLDFLGLLFLTTLWTYVFGRRIGAAQSAGAAKAYLIVGLLGCLGVLGVFKYLNFFIDSLAALWGTDPAGMGVHWRLILPIGVSFYVFQAVSYLVDVYRKDAEATARFFDFAAFIALFPQLIAGPILRFKDLTGQFAYRVHSVDLFLQGMTIFLIGLAKKVLLADTVAPLANLAFETPDPTLALAWVGAAAYMIQLYFDFSGYSDMAIGLGLMMGFHFIANFDTPYISRSITEFWRRWHISLSVWLRDYLYIPLGGNRKGVVRTYVNLMLVMLLGGLWHGANWTFVIWGLWHGTWLALERATGRDKGADLPALASTLLIVLLGWVMFRAASVGAAWDVYAGMLGLNGVALTPQVAMAMTSESLVFLILGIFVAAVEPWLNRGAALHLRPDPSGDLSVLNAAVPSVLMLGLGGFAIMKLAEQSFSPFLYFQF
ncbi:MULTISPECIES: MBOAT family O-acyltransferase [unclassified Yoonia]|uniref:MBOAT family O-acyltransferase n=1 Tax=unclassified Yoonia TaxID=2629118 RepID=UPI002AFDEDA5|nr:MULTISPECIES: MBOAT family O-acyltransferase [unclassified Yoonia]